LCVGHEAFNGIVLTPLVRNGEDWRAPDGAHVAPFVYKEMFTQVILDFQGLGDIRTLKDYEIRFLYESQREKLKKYQILEIKNRN